MNVNIIKETIKELIIKMGYDVVLRYEQQLIGKSKLTVGVMEDILNKKKSFFDLVKEGILEYLDVVFSS